MYQFLLRIPWYVFLYKYHKNSFQNIATDFKMGFFLSRLHNMVRIRDIQAKLVWLDSLWFNTILSKERKKTVYALKAFSRILQFSCVLPTFFSWVNPETEVIKSATCATTKTMKLSETSIVCRASYIVWVIHLSHHEPYVILNSLFWELCGATITLIIFFILEFLTQKFQFL